MTSTIMMQTCFMFISNTSTSTRYDTQKGSGPNN